MNKFIPDQYCQGVAITNSATQSNNFFVERRDALDQGISDRCKYLADMAAYRDYSGVATLFNQTLAGKFPFTSSASEDPSNEASTSAIQAFYQLFDAHEKATVQALTLSSRFGPSREAALAFLQQMDGLRGMFASLLSDSKGTGVMTLDFVPRCRSNKGQEIGGNQIIDWATDVGADQFKDHEPERGRRWQLGEPVSLTLRWAKDSPALPVLGKDQPDVRVNGREATFVYTDAWSLISLLARHHAPVAEFPSLVDPHPFTLAFALDTMEDLSTTSNKAVAVLKATKVFVQLSIMPPGKKDGLAPSPFPAKAPGLVLMTPE